MEHIEQQWWENYFLHNYLEYLAGSMFYSAQPPTPSATPTILGDKTAASSPPLCTLEGWGMTKILSVC